LFLTCALPSSPEPAEPDPQKARAARQLRALEELAAIGMELARALRDQVVAATAVQASEPEDGEPNSGAASGAVSGETVALAFSRIARAVRQTLALEARLADEDRAGEAEARARREAERQDQGMARLRFMVRAAAVQEAVEEAIEADCGPDREDGGDAERAERLLADLDERLEDADDSYFDQLSTSRAAARICRELGVAFDADLWSDEDDENCPVRERMRDGFAEARAAGEARGGAEPWAAAGAEGLAPLERPPP
jgi:hypothetical protein